MKGLMKGYSLNFPIIIDELGVFSSEIKSNSSLIIVDRLFKVIKRWKLPIETNEYEELQMLIKDRRKRNDF
jgi:hypothetical protein